MSSSELSIDELIGVIRSTNIPTILVEGKSDAKIYRWIEKQVGTFNGSILDCGGRSKVLELYKRKKEFRNSKVVFLADKDMWVFKAIPEEYSDIIWTEGYSIENDLFTGGYSIECLFEEEEKSDLMKIIASVVQWFAFEVEKFISSETLLQCYHLSEMLDSNYNLEERFLEKICFADAPEKTKSLIINDYTLKLRGKTLHQIYVHLLSDKKRESKFSKQNIIEICLKSGSESSKLHNIVVAIKYKLSNWHYLQQAAPGKKLH